MFASPAPTATLISATAAISLVTATVTTSLDREFVGQYRHKLKRVAGRLKIAERRAILDAQQLGAARIGELHSVRPAGWPMTRA